MKKTILFLSATMLAGCSVGTPSGGTSNSGLSTLQVAVDNANVAPGADVQLQVSAGTAPYSGVIISGGGTMVSPTEYEAPTSVSGTDSVWIEVTDAKGATGYVSITVTAPSAPAQLVNPDVASYKPTGSEDPSSVVSMCTTLATQASGLGVGRLIIAFEGLDSFDATGTVDAYVYYANLWNHQPTSLPGAGSAGYVVHELMDPVVEKYYSKFEFLVFPETSITDGQASVAQTCAETWLSVNKAHPVLTVIGHSYGGDAANQLTNNLNADSVAVDSVVTVDARTKYYVGTLAKSSNVRLWENYYETITPFLNGYVVNGADLNDNLNSEGLTHIYMPGSPVVYSAVTALLH